MGRISAEVSLLRSLKKLRKSGLESSNLPLWMGGWGGWGSTGLRRIASAGRKTEVDLPSVILLTLMCHRHLFLMDFSASSKEMLGNSMKFPLGFYNNWTVEAFL